MLGVLSDIKTKSKREKTIFSLVCASIITLIIAVPAFYFSFVFRSTDSEKITLYKETAMEVVIGPVKKLYNSIKNFKQI